MNIVKTGPLTVTGEKPVDLSQWDPGSKAGFKGSKKEGKKALKEINRRLESLQEQFYARREHAMLIVLQGMDTGGKDGTIRHVFDGVNPQGCRVASFKRPNEEELAHDYLWRAHRKTPRKGEIVIFNRSHYEDALIARVHNLVPRKVWSRRYGHINAFEKMLADEGTIILKFFLHIDKEEQKSRLQARLDLPEKNWKFDPGDLEERKLWDQYIAAYEAVLSRAATPCAPWRIVPANRKWIRNLVVGSVITETLSRLNLEPPKSDYDLSGIKIE